MKYSSTVLKRFSDNCPGALQKLMDDEPYDREHFQAGIAAHAVLQICAQKEATDYDEQAIVADAVVQELIEKGRAFNERPEPPMNPEHAFAGRDIALQYLQNNPLPENMLSIEGGYGMDKRGKECSYYDEHCRYRAVIDAVYLDVIGDEDWSTDGIVVRDYKSAWPTGEADLDTLQRKGQAVLIWLKHCQGDTYLGAIRQEAVNLRTGASFTRDIMLDEEGITLLKRWREDILMLCNAADTTRDYRPGSGCLSCDYTLSCDHCIDAYKGDPECDATALAALEAVRGALIKTLKAKTREQAVKIEGGYVGFKVQEKLVPVENASQLLSDIWTMDDADDHPELRGCLKGIKLTGANIENALKVIYPGRGANGKENMEMRKTLMVDLLETKAESRFGVHCGHIEIPEER